MKRMNRRRFVAVTSVTATSVLLVACGNEPLTEEELRPTQIPDVPGAPPTIAPLTATPGGEEPATGEATATDGGGAAAEAIMIEASDDFRFSPSEVEVAPGQTVTLHNIGFAQHNLVVDDWGIETPLLNNDEMGDVVIPEDAEVGSSVEFYCSVPGHKESGMVGTFTVIEAGAAAPAAETATGEEAPAEEAAGGGSAEPIIINALDSFAFDPSEVDVMPGQTVTLHNTGFAQHDLVVDEWGIATELLNNDQTGDVVIPEDAEVGSSVTFYCSVPGHRQSGMEGTFTVVEGGSSAAAAPAEEEAPATAEADDPAEEAAAGGGSAEPIVINALDSFAFDPSEVDVMPGQTVTLHNTGFAQHDLVVDEWGIATELLNNDQTGDVVIPEDAEVGSSVTFYCSVPGHRQSGMEGTFTVVEGGGSSAAAPAEEEAPATAETEAATAASNDAATPAASSNTPQAVTVVGTKWEFQPAEFEIAPGGVITFQNETDMSMGLSSDAWDENAMTPMIKSVPSGGSGEFTVPADATVGDVIDFTSNLSEAENQGMVGKITIVAGDGASATPVASPAAASGSGNVIEVKMLDTFAFEPSEFEAAVGDTIRLTNDGFMEHDFAVDEWSDEPMTPYLKSSETADVVVPDVATSGEQYEFYCSVPGHKPAGMVGTITIL